MNAKEISHFDIHATVRCGNSVLLSARLPRKMNLVEIYSAVRKMIGRMTGMVTLTLRDPNTGMTSNHFMRFA